MKRKPSLLVVFLMVFIDLIGLGAIRRSGQVEAMDGRTRKFLQKSVGMDWRPG